MGSVQGTQPQDAFCDSIRSGTGQAEGAIYALPTSAAVHSGGRQPIGDRDKTAETIRARSACVSTSMEGTGRTNLAFHGRQRPHQTWEVYEGVVIGR